MKDYFLRFAASFNPVPVRVQFLLDQAVIEVLSHLGYRVLTTTTGAEALAILQQENAIEVLFSDVVLPGGLNGIELARTARRLKPELKVVLSSGYVGEEARHDLMRGEFSFLPKPYRPAELATKLTEVLAGGYSFTLAGVSQTR